MQLLLIIMKNNYIEWIHLIQCGSLCYALLLFQFLEALELSQSPMLLQLMTEVLCRDHRHFMEDLFQASFKRIARR